MKNQAAAKDKVNRRNFLRGSSVGTLMAMMGGVPVRAAPQTRWRPYIRLGPPMNCAVIGCGQRGREILTALGEVASADPAETVTEYWKPHKTIEAALVIAVCDTYAPSVRRAKEIAPKAEGYDDYRKVLDNKEVKAVIVATPTHQHKEIVLDALAAGKHVYCEAPLAHTMEDAHAIAKAAQAAERVNFQPGLQVRADPQHNFLLPFMRSELVGRWLKARIYSHKKSAWRRTSPTAEREKELNWRLSRATSPGLIGENGIHQVDKVSWFLNALPIAVTGFGNILQWKGEPDREVPDTVQAVFEYPGEVCSNYEATLGNSFEGDCEMLYGSFVSVVMRDNTKAWLFKEADAREWGWEVYARKEQFYKQKGIVAQLGSSNSAADPYWYYYNRSTLEQLSSAFEAFILNSNYLNAASEDFTAAFGSKANGLKEHLAEQRKAKAWFPAPTYREGFQANVTVLKANEAILNKQRIIYQKEWFEI